MTNIDMLQEDAMFPWLADESMADLDNNFEADLLDAMADRADELEEAMREADQSEFQFIEPMEDFHDDQS